MNLNQEQIAEFYHRSYVSVDGLWFTKVEERRGFDEALKVDQEVWRVLPKIQARFLKSIAKTDSGLVTLVECFTTKLKLEGYSFTFEKHKNGFRVKIDHCPWHDRMVKSGRERLSCKIGDVICITDYKAFASEFCHDISVKIEEQICKGKQNCILCFELAPNIR